MIKKDDWRADGVRWRNIGLKKSSCLPVEKRYYNLQNELKADGGFKRHVFNKTNKSDIVLRLVQYTGDHNLVVPYAHLNSKKTGAYSMTLPSTLVLLKEACEKKDAHLVYKDAVNKTTSKFDSINLKN